MGVSKAVAGATVAVFTLTSIVGRLGFGFLADRYPKRLILGASLGLVAVGLPVLALATNLWQALAGIMLIAPGFGGTIPVRPALLADYFGTEDLRHRERADGPGHDDRRRDRPVGGRVRRLVENRAGEYDLGW